MQFTDPVRVSFDALLFGRVLFEKKTDWSESKKEKKLVALRDKKRKNAAQILLAGPNGAQIF